MVHRIHTFIRLVSGFGTHSLLNYLLLGDAALQVSMCQEHDQLWQSTTEEKKVQQVEKYLAWRVTGGSSTGDRALIMCVPSAASYTPQDSTTVVLTVILYQCIFFRRENIEELRFYAVSLECYAWQTSSSKMSSKTHFPAFGYKWVNLKPDIANIVLWTDFSPTKQTKSNFLVRNEFLLDEYNLPPFTTS